MNIQLFNTSEDKTEGHDKDTTVTLEEAVTARYVKVTVDSLILERIQVFQCMK